MPNSNGKKAKRRAPRTPTFDLRSFLETAGVARQILKFRRSEKIYLQGDPARGVKYIQEGGVKLSVINEAGKEAVVAMLGPGDFFARDAWPGSQFAWALPRRSCPRPYCSLKKMR